GFWTPHRDRGAEALAKTLAAERNKRMVLLGDLNGTLDDRELDRITSRLRSAHDTAGNGFHFTWPAKVPFVRIDPVLRRGVEPEKAWVLPAATSDHRRVAAETAWCADVPPALRASRDDSERTCAAAGLSAGSFARRPISNGPAAPPH